MCVSDSCWESLNPRAGWLQSCSYVFRLSATALVAAGRTPPSVTHLSGPHRPGLRTLHEEGIPVDHRMARQFRFNDGGVWLAGTRNGLGIACEINYDCNGSPGQGYL